MTGSASTGSTNIVLADCSAIISNLTGGTELNSSTALTQMISVASKQYTILDNIAINGGGVNGYGIYYNTASNNTLNAGTIYNHVNHGILMVYG